MKQPLTPEHRRRVAYHEAGHAVACYALWRPLDYVTVIPSTDYSGQLNHMHKPITMYSLLGGFRGDTDTYLADHVVIAFAGPVADAAFEIEQEEQEHPWGDCCKLWEYTEAQLFSDEGDGRCIGQFIDSYNGFNRPPFGPAGRTPEDLTAAMEERYSEEGREKLREFFFQMASMIVEEYWQAVEALAEALLERNTLTQAEVWAVCSQALDEEAG